MSNEVIYSFCVIEAVPRDRNRAVALVAKLLKGGFTLQSSDYLLIPSSGTPQIKSIHTLVRQPGKTDSNVQFDGKLIDAQIAELQQGAVGFTVLIA